MNKEKKYSIVEDVNVGSAEEQSMEYGISYNLMSLQELANQAKAGINMSFLNQLISKLSISLQEVGDILHVSLRTLQRYDAAKKLDTDLSSKILKLAELQAHGLEVFGNEANFNKWLRKPVPALGGQVPLSLLDTPYGFEMVDDALGRMQHGIFA